MSKLEIIIHKGFWTEQEVKNDPTSLYLFGDNDIKKGKGGQAIIRYLTNSYGIPTKKYPSSHTSAYYYDDEYKSNHDKIKTAIEGLPDYLNSPGTPKFTRVVFPEKGFGTGLSKLPKKAPKTYRYLQKKVLSLANKISEDGNGSKKLLEYKAYQPSKLSSK